jgi:uncharacterized iron-regulated membrane protein
MTLRAILVKVHLWVGLVAAPVLLVVGLTGALLVLEGPITDRLEASTALVEPRGALRSIAELLASVQKTHPGSDLLAVQMPRDARHSAALVVSAGPEKGAEAVLVDPYTARVLGEPPDQTPFFQRVRQLHRQLLLGKNGNTVVVGMALALAFLAITGPVVWWPRRRVGVRWDRTGWRRVLDLHALLGAISCAFLFMFAVTGAVVHWDDGVQSLIGRVTGNASPRPPRNPATSTCAADALLDVDHVIAAGQRLLPGARVTSIQLPGARVTALRVLEPGAAVARLSLKYPEDRTPNGRSILLMDRCTGRAAFTIDTRSAPMSYLYPREWNRELHTGDIFGWPSLVLAFVFSLGLCAMGLTGPLVWLMKRREARARG